MKSPASAETKAVLLLPFLSFVSLALSLLIAGKADVLVPVMRNSLTLINVFGGHKFFLFFLILALALACYYLFSFFTARKHDNALGKGVKSLLVLVLISSFGSTMLGISVVSVFFLVSPADVVSFTGTLEALEIAVFGQLPEFFLISVFTGTAIEDALVFFYRYLYVLIPLALFFIAQKRINFKRAFVGYFFAFSLLIPLWYLAPAISPQAVYLSERIPTGYSLSQAQTVYDESSGFYKDTAAYYASVWIDKSFFAVSSFPSFHVYLVILFGYYLAKTDRRWLGFSIIWVVFTTVGTFYTLQHYLLDALAGVIFAVIVIRLLDTFILEESSDEDLYSICDLLTNRLFARQRRPRTLLPSFRR